MEMTGERLIMAPQMEVWAALNDPATLKDCIIGCDSIEKLSGTHMVATASIKLGPVSARFSGKLQLSDMNPPDGYTITGEATGGAAGFAKGGAVVRLATQSGATLLSYTVSAQVGGKIAQVGGRLIDATAKSMADQFFRKFAERLESPPAPIPSPDGLPAGSKMIEKVGLLTRLWRWLTGRAE